ncbi:Vacuolar protein sorting-associated protein 1 [Dictyocoela roeselum]|nr:Vacuolar protein sorting-associated protein 1 [Dictyocoela roeselum]
MKLSPKLSSLYKITKITLPSITVVGSQSSGKSSVLEQIINHEIFPRGSDLVTRCPVVVYMRSGPKLKFEFIGDYNRHEYEFLHKNVRIDKNEMEHKNNSEDGNDFDKISNKNAVTQDKEGKQIVEKSTERVFFTAEDAREHIKKLTIQICGEGVSDTPIELVITDPNSIEITIIDLPGLVKIPVHQPDSIATKIEQIVHKYAQNEPNIILATTPANADISTSEALQFARRVDPKGTRTLGVVTKIDLMDADTDCLDILTNRKYPLALGYVGVVNRSQRDLNTRISAEKSLLKEKTFFKNSAYNALPNVGSEYLRRRVAEIYKQHLASELPRIKRKLKGDLDRLDQLIFAAKAINGSQIISSLQGVLRTLFQKPFKKKLNRIGLNKIECSMDKSKDEGNSEIILKGDNGSFFFKNKLKTITTKIFFEDNFDLGEYDFDDSIFISEEIFNTIVKDRLGIIEKVTLEICSEIYFLYQEHIRLSKNEIIAGLFKNKCPTQKCTHVYNNVHRSSSDDYPLNSNPFYNDILREDELSGIPEIIFSFVDRLVEQQAALFVRHMREYLAILCSHVNLQHPEFNKKAIVDGVIADMTRSSWIFRQVVAEKNFEERVIDSYAREYLRITRNTIYDYLLKSQAYYFEDVLTKGIIEHSDHKDVAAAIDRIKEALLRFEVRLERERSRVQELLNVIIKNGF